MDILKRVAKGVAAARGAMGSDPAGEGRIVNVEWSEKPVEVALRRRRSSGALFVRLGSPAEGGALALDLSPDDARELAAALASAADEAAEGARAVGAPPVPEA